MTTQKTNYKFIRFFEDISMDDLPLVGGKNASLGEMIRTLQDEGIRLPSGFVVTADAYTEILEANGVKDKLSQILSGIDKNNVQDLSARAQSARSLIRLTGLPQRVKDEITDAYGRMEEEYHDDVDVAVRSSATAEDLPQASFAGQQETFLNIRGATALIDACSHCFASLFTDRALSYRIDQGFDHLAVRLSVGVQKMVRSDLASSGVIFTLDPESGFRKVVLVTSGWGLGENIVAGRIDPDEFLVFKPAIDKCSRPIIRRKIGAKQQRLIYSSHGTRTTRNVDVAPSEQRKPSLSDAEVIQLAKWGCVIEDYYSKLRGVSTPMDIEWAKDGDDGLLYILQARPETVHASESIGGRLEFWRLQEKGEVLLQGRSVGEKIGGGRARIIHGVHELQKFRDGEVLVADMTDPDWEPVMKRAAAIVTNKGGRTCHAAIVSREFGVPCVVGTEKAMEVLDDGALVTVSCAEGAVGFIYDGLLTWDKEVIELETIPKPKTQLMVNIGNPDHAFAIAGLPVDGVGLAREEFIIANEVRVHPMALCRPQEVTDEKTRNDIQLLCRGYANPKEFFVEKLAEGVGAIAAAFYPRPVIVRLADFKTNEYANLIGGEQFEHSEENPMIGFRGASRYLDERYREAFVLECKALRMVRKEMGLTNLKLMVPFCRTVGEGKRVVDELARHGLVQHEDGLEIYVMCELPSNVFLIDEFARVFDGFSIGSNDLTQLVLGVDRDSGKLSEMFDERDPAVLAAIAAAIAGAKRAGKKIGICGQAPSDYPEMVRFLIEHGIDSISLTEDVVIKTLLLVAEEEKKAEIKP